MRTPGRGHPSSRAGVVAMVAIIAIVLLGDGQTGEASVTSSSFEAARPNILVILTDDQRPAVDTLSVMPNVQRLFVGGGVDFPRSVVTTPLCCPSRSSILTGRYAHNTGVLTNGNQEEVLALDQRTTIQAYLQSIGYQTALVGKLFNTWPLGTDPPFFDRWALLNGGYEDPVMNVDGSVHHVDGYSTTVLANQAVGILDDFNATDDPAPWFLYIAPHAPHSPYTVDDPYADAPVPPWRPDPSFDERNIRDKPPWVQWRSYTRAQANDLRAAQLRTLMSVDDLVGQVFDEVDRLGEQNTLAVFMSDNGYLWGEHRIGENKRFPYTASIGVPLLIRWPGHVVAGTSDPRLAANIDLVPTIQQAVGGPPSPDLLPDGRSLLASNLHRRLLLEYWQSPDSPHIPSWSGILRRSSLYVEWRNDKGKVTFREYYDLRRDPFELRNLLGDRDPSNDPPVGRLSRSLARLRTCATTSCP